MSRRTMGLIAALCLALSAIVAAPALGAIGFVRQWTVAGFAGGETGVAVDRADSVIYVADPFFGATAGSSPTTPTAPSSGCSTGRMASTSSGRPGWRWTPRTTCTSSRATATACWCSPRPAPRFARSRRPAPDAFDDLAQGIAHDAQDNLYVADTRASRIEVFNTGGGLVRKFALGGNFVDDVAVTRRATSTRS